MRKYFIASVVAMVAFAMAAFAASLTVNAGTLQAGDDTTLECADEANVLAWGYNDTTVGPLPGGSVPSVTIELVGAEDCTAGEHLHVVLLDENDAQVARGQVAGDPGAPHLIDGQNGPFTFEFSSNPAAEDIDGIRIGIDQGHMDYSY